MSDGLQKPILRAPGKAACWGQPTPELYHEGGRDAAEAPTRYGRRKISRMFNDWNNLRAAVASGDIEAIQHHFDRCEEWVDFAFGASREIDNE